MEKGKVEERKAKERKNWGEEGEEKKRRGRQQGWNFSIKNFRYMLLFCFVLTVWGLLQFSYDPFLGLIFRLKHPKLHCGMRTLDPHCFHWWVDPCLTFLPLSELVRWSRCRNDFYPSCISQIARTGVEIVSCDHGRWYHPSNKAHRFCSCTVGNTKLWRSRIRHSTASQDWRHLCQNYSWDTRKAWN